MVFTIVSLSLWGLAMGFLGANLMPIICLVVDSRYRATAMGVLNFCAAGHHVFAIDDADRTAGARQRRRGEFFPDS